ncbi:MAG: GDP-mannose 4,6-dehydratase [Crocinitomicaceae bacterium]|nr:GDP-mannose 4,6-dehydratase [Crocinitomicaceae bacterium]
MKILVTGGAGFIGSHLVDELIARGHVVIVVDNLVNGRIENLSISSNSGRLTFEESDILEPDKMKSLCHNVDVVYHLACLGVRHSLHSPFENHLVNAEGSLNMLAAALSQKVKRFFYISTSEIYGDIRDFPIDEEGVPLPKTVYGSSKLAGENYAYSYHTCFGLNVTITRIFNNYGPRAHYEGDAGEVIPRSIVNMLYGKAPVIFGDGSVTRDFFYVKDTARALCDLLEINNVNGQIINIGTGEEISMKHLLETLIRLMGLEGKIQINYQDNRPADVPRLWVNPAKFKKITGFVPAFSFEEGLLATINYYRELMKEKDMISEVIMKNWEK